LAPPINERGVAWPGPGCSACDTKLGCMGLRGGRAVAGLSGAAMTGVGGGTKAGGGGGEPNDIGLTSIQIRCAPGLAAVRDIVIDIGIIAALMADFLFELGDRVVVGHCVILAKS